MKEDNNLLFGFTIGILCGVILGAILQIQHTDKVILKRDIEIERLMQSNDEQTYLLDSIYKK